MALLEATMVLATLYQVCLFVCTKGLRLCGVLLLFNNSLHKQSGMAVSIVRLPRRAHNKANTGTNYCLCLHCLGDAHALPPLRVCERAPVPVCLVFTAFAATALHIYRRYFEACALRHHDHTACERWAVCSSCATGCHITLMANALS
jgi:hypothetical protein